MGYALGITLVEKPGRRGYTAMPTSVRAARTLRAVRASAPRTYAAMLGDAAPVSPPISVGSKATTDPLLSQASLDASQILKAASLLPILQRPAYINRQLNAKRYGLALDASRKAGALVKRGVARDQALYDGMRLALANYYFDLAVKGVKEALAKKRNGAAGLGALGSSADEKMAACIALAAGGGTVNAILSAVGGGAIGGAIGGATGQIGSVLDCSGSQETARQQAASQAATAQATVDAAQANAIASQTQSAAQLQQARERNATVVKVSLIGAGVLGVLGVGYMIFRK